MALASSIFWIIAGALYILYRAFREYPSETVSGVLLFLVFLSGLLVYIFVGNWLLKVNIVLGAIVRIGVPIGLLIYGIKTKFEEDEKIRKSAVEYKEKMHKVRATLTEEDYEKYVKKNWVALRVSIDKNAYNYWRKEPYYKHVRDCCECERSIELAKKEKEERLRMRATPTDSEQS